MAKKERKGFSVFGDNDQLGREVGIAEGYKVGNIETSGLFERKTNRKY